MFSNKTTPYSKTQKKLRFYDDSYRDEKVDNSDTETEPIPNEMESDTYTENMEEPCDRGSGYAANFRKSKLRLPFYWLVLFGLN